MHQSNFFQRPRADFSSSLSLRGVTKCTLSLRCLALSKTWLASRPPIIERPSRDHRRRSDVFKEHTLEWPSSRTMSAEVESRPSETNPATLGIIFDQRRAANIGLSDLQAPETSEDSFGRERPPGQRFLE